MKISIICAVSNNNVIGWDDTMPWRLPTDLRYFRKRTIGKPIVMGRRTFDSLGKPLKGRRNLVLSRNSRFHPKGVEVFRKIPDLLEALKHTREIMVIGGGQIYEEFLPIAGTLYLTRINHVFLGDTYFPDVNWNDWEEVWRRDHRVKLDLRSKRKQITTYSFIKYSRKKTVGKDLAGLDK